MSDFYSGEAHQNVSEFFPRKARTGKRSIKIPAAKMLAAIAGAAVTATLLFSAFVDCFASEILPTQATLNVSVMNLDREREVEWLLYEEGSDTPVQQGEMDSKRGTIPIDNLDPDTKYRIVFITHTEDGEKQLGEYEFTTPGQKAPAVSPLPSAVPPPPAQPTPPAIVPSTEPSPSISPSPSPSPSISPSPSPSPSLSPSPTPTPEPTPPPIPAPIMGTPYLDNIAQGADSDPFSRLNFPYDLNSSDTYINEMVSLLVTYTIEEEGNEYTDSYEITPENTTAPDLELFYRGSLTSSAVLTYNRTQYDADGNVVGVEENLTVTSDQLNIQSLYINSGSGESTYGGGITLSNLVFDENNLLKGNITIDVAKGKYQSKNSISELHVPYVDDTGDSIGTLEYAIFGDQFDGIAGPLEIGPFISTGSAISSQFEIDLSPYSMPYATTMELQVIAEGAWVLDGVPLYYRSGDGYATFTTAPIPEMPEATAGTPDLVSATSAPDMGTDITISFPFSMNSDDEVTNNPYGYDIEYTVENADGTQSTYTENTIIEDPASFSAAEAHTVIPYGGGVSVKATLIYDSFIESTGMEVFDRTVDSQTFTLSEIRFTGTGVVNSLEVDAVNGLIDGTVTFNVSSGQYPSSSALDSQLRGNNIWMTVYTVDEQPTQIAQWMINNTAKTSSGENLTVSFADFDISNQSDNFVLGDNYTFEFSIDGQWYIGEFAGSSSNGTASAEYPFGEAPAYVEPVAQTPEITERSPTAPDIIVQYPFALNSYVPSAGDSITIEETGYDVLYDGTISEEAAFTNTRTYKYDPNGETNEVIIDSQNNVLYINDREGLDNYQPEDVAYSVTATFTYENGTKAITSTHNQTPYKFLGNQETNATNTVIPDYDNISIADDICTIPFTATFKDILKGTGQLDVYNAEVYAAGQEQSSDSYQITVGEDTVTITGTAVVDTTQLETIDGINIDVYAYGTWTQDGIVLANTNAHTYAYVRINFNTVTFNRFDPGVDLAGHGITVKDIMVWYDNGYTSIDNYPTGFRFSPGETVETVVVMDVVPPQPLLVTPNHSMTNIDKTTIVMTDPLQISTSGEYSYLVSFTMPDSEVVVTPSIIISAN